MSRRTSNNGIEKLQSWEGEVLYAYDDADKGVKKKRIMPGDKVIGTLSIGYGHTGPDVKPAMTCTHAQALQWLREDLREAEDAVDAAVKVPLSDNQFDALVAFTFNAGVDAFIGSTLLKRLNKGEYDAVPYELLKWNKTTITDPATGKKKKVKSDGLVNRRNAEIGLWASGSYVASNTVPAEPMKKPIVTTESMTTGAGIFAATGLAGSSIFDGNGPVQYVLAGALALAFAVAIILFLKKRV